jgi:predicted TIM-barrel fold metal-dependent hydrolase
MLGLPPDRDNWRSLFGGRIRDPGSFELRQPAGYLFTDLPEVDPSLTYGDVLIAEMDRWDVEAGLVPVTLADEDLGSRMVSDHPDRLHAGYGVDPNRGAAGVVDLRRAVASHGARAATCFPCGTNPAVAIDDPSMYPLYAACAEMDIPIFVNAGVPGPRVPAWPQDVRRLDNVCYDFPELVVVTRHGCEPWTDLAVTLMLKWPGLHYSPSAFAPRHYPRDIIDYANTRGADKVVYAGYFPYGLTLERIFTELPTVPFRDHVWPLFLRDNARRILHLPPR